MGRHFVRPKPMVLDESALVPKDNLVLPAPDVFTHEVKTATDYRYRPSSSKVADGQFAVGTRVVFRTRYDTGLCCVIDGRGLRVYVACGDLRELTSED